MKKWLLSLFLIAFFTLPGSVEAAPAISGISDNSGSYAGSAIPKFDKLEITFSVTTAASRPYLPFDPSPPTGITPATGITVEGLFSSDNWQTTLSQPGFYYQNFDHQVKGTRDWLYPQNSYSWKIRFAPNREGVWQYKLKVQDSSGTTETTPQSFTVGSSANKGFIKVSPTDSRYFEFEDGTFFPGLGYNMNFDQISWNNPIQQNQVNFQQMGQNGIQFIRLWLSQWAIHANSWSIWRAFPGRSFGYVPVDGIDFADHYPGRELSLAVGKYGPCNVVEGLKARPALVKGNVYRVRARVKPVNITGPSASGSPFGFVIKTGDWLWDNTDTTKRCNYPGTGSVIAATYSGVNWTPTPAPKAPRWLLL